MNRRFVSALVALSIGLPVLSLAPPVSASTPILEWTGVDVPGENDLTVVTPSEVTGIAAGDNGVVYAIDGEYGRVYRSLNYAVDWEDITKYLERAGATVPATMIAIAPDNEGFVAVLADGGTAIYVSLNGGYEWSDINFPAVAALPGDTVVTALAVSPEYTVDGTELREVAVGTAWWGDDASDGTVWVLQGGCGWSTWQDQELYVDPGHIGADVSAVAYSEDFPNDDTMLVVCSTGSDVSNAPTDYTNRTWLVLGQRDVDNGGTDWGYFSSDDYPVLIGDDSPGDYVEGDAVGVSYVRAWLAQPSDYSSDDEDTRTVFLSVEREPDSNDDVYRVVGDDVDLSDNDRMNVDGGSDINIWTIAYRGDTDDGILLAGMRENVPSEKNTQVYHCEDPFADPPEWEESSVPPTGPGRAYLVWAPNVSLAYCGTSRCADYSLAGFDESALSASTYGDVWRQMAIIDTTFTLTDLAITPDGDDLFLTTSDAFGPESVWLSYSEPLGKRWYRILTVDSDSDAVMLKLSANYGDDDTIYIVEHNGDRIAVSHDGGATWRFRHNNLSEPILDFVILDESTLLAAIPGGQVVKSTNEGRSWDDPVDTGLDDINMLSLAGDGTIFAGGQDGYVSYSTDGGDTFTVIKEPVGTGDVQVLADVGFGDNDWLFAGTDVADEGLWRWKLGTSDSWQQMDYKITRLGDGQEIGGLLEGPEGTLYALTIEPASDDTGGMTRWLCPTCAPCAELEYNHITNGLPDGASFAAADEFITAYPVGTLWSNDVENDIYAIDSVGEHIYLFRDTLCKRGPDLDTPENGAHLDANPCACNKDAVVAFNWEKLKDVDEYELSFYLDASVGDPLWDYSSDHEGLVLSPSGDTTEFADGLLYGWRVRAIEPLFTPWSDMWTFTPLLCPVQDLVPANGAADISTTPVFTWDSPCEADGYEFTLATDPSYSHLVASFSGPTALTETRVGGITLQPGTDYFWRVRALRGQAYGSWTEGYFRTASPVAAVETSPQTIDVPPQPPAVSNTFVWTMFGLVVALMSVIIVLVMRTAARY